MQDLAHLGAFGPGGQGLGSAVDLNTRGQIAGTSLDASRVSRAVSWTVSY
jgi:hypothetical protein